MAARGKTIVPADEPVIAFERLLDAPREMVWEVWTEAFHVGQWWGPNGFSITDHGMNVRAGGTWDFVMHGPDGKDYDNKITYHEVVRPERLVYSHGAPGDADQFHVTVTFANEGGKTRLTMHSRFPSIAARDHVAREFGAVEGGTQHLDRLEGHLAGLRMASDPRGTVKAGVELHMERILDAPRDLVFAMWTDPKHFRAWWGPAGSDNGETRLDVRPGGEIFIQMRGPGFDHPMGGAFVEIDAPRRLVFTSKAFPNPDGSWKLINLNTVTFDDLGGKTRMTLHVVVQQADEDVMVPVAGMEMGWTGSLDRLRDYVAKLR